MSKSFGCCPRASSRFATPAYAQDNPRRGRPVSRDADRRGAPADERRQTISSSPPRAAARSSRTCRSPSPPSAASSCRIRGATDIRQLNQLAPSLLVSSTGTEANGSARIRGIGTVGDNPGLESSVAVFIDGVYRSRSGIGLNELGEIERIEVLRGPQGTLFGRNASAGLIHVITRRPELRVRRLCRAQLRQLRLYPRRRRRSPARSASTIAFRLDARLCARDGFYDVVNAAGGTESEVNDRDRFFVRGQLLFEPNDALSVRLIGDYTHARRILLRRRLSSTARDLRSAPRASRATSPSASRATAARRRQPHRRRAASLGGDLPVARRSVQPAASRSRPGRTYRGETNDWGVSAQVDWDLGGADG